MSLYSQLTGILSARNELDDQYNSKSLFKYGTLQGVQNGINVFFQIPQSRIVVYSDSVMNLFPQLFKNDAALIFNTDYKMLSLLDGTFQFLTGAPGAEDNLVASFNWVWLTDIEWDRHLTRAAAEMQLSTYYTTASAIPGADPIPSGIAPSDIPDALFGATCILAASLAADALALRFSTRYDTSAGDQSYSPSQMAKSFGELAKTLQSRGYNMRDDFYKGQGRQYRPTVATTGFVLPNWAPPR